MRYAGADATSAYHEIHAPDIISETLPAEMLMGAFNLETPDVPAITAANTLMPAPLPQTALPATTDLLPPATKPALYSLISAHDFADVAKTELSEKGKV